MEDKMLREPLKDAERARFEKYAAEIFSRMGLDLDSLGGHETPRRWVTALWDMSEGYDGDPKLSTLFPVECPTCPDEEKTHVVEGSRMRWGLIPSWSKDPTVGFKMINARAETVAITPAFRDALKTRRCLIPADGFYELPPRTRSSPISTTVCR